MAKELSTENLSAILDRAISKSETFSDTKLSKERATVQEYYRGEQPKRLNKGDSSYVSRDVFDAVDSMRATILETFLAHQRIVFFQPEKGEGPDGAKQATDYCRHTFFKENPGEDILYDVITDGLQNRYSVAKVYHETVTEEEEHEFEGFTLDELEQFVAEFENYEFTETDTSQAGLYTGTIKVTTTTSTINVEVIQPEDFLVASKSCSIQDAKYAIHRTSKTKSQLLAHGFEEKMVEKISFGPQQESAFDFEKQMRHEAVGDLMHGDDEYQEAQREVDVYEIYILLDMNKTGRSKLWKITYAGKEILEKEEVSRKPFAAFVPLPIPHTFFGENFAKSVIPIQNARTVLIRQIINHSVRTNNARNMVLNGTVQNPTELLDNRIGGIVNVRRMDGVAPLPQPPLNPYVFNLIGMIDADKEEVTGVSSLSQGMSKEAVSTQNSEGMIEQLISQSQQRQKIIARRFGYFVRELWHLIYGTAVDYVDEAEYIDVTGSYVPVDPSQWKERKAASIELSLGYGEQERAAQKWMQLDQYFRSDPDLAIAYTPDKRYEVIGRALEKQGIEDLKSILTPPEEIEPQEPSEMETLQVEQLKSQIAYQNAQATAMTMKAETDRMKVQGDLLKAQSEVQAKGTKTQLDTRELDHSIRMDVLEMENAMNADETKAIFAPDS